MQDLCNKEVFLNKICFFQNFFHKCKLYIIWNWFITKTNWIQQKLLVANQTECTGLEKISVSKFLESEKCKPCESLQKNVPEVCCFLYFFKERVKLRLQILEALHMKTKKQEKNKINGINFENSDNKLKYL